MSDNNSADVPLPKASGGSHEFISGEIEYARSDVARAEEYLSSLHDEQRKINDLQKTIDDHQARLNVRLKANEQKLAHASHVVAVRKRTLFQMENGADA